ncbi:hypothetical protein J4G33_12650 [Actinotalea sp. BY-33]|uniref:O-antigen ligase domain-containing protein n=1 Tax=Actinotalea soli TaxID=2819234 RepID=A0A939LU15_9CELL|nr:hypothetical protein [Actinotalea soli]MBO1752655.1 hypothetical protein [Actinotalea soli]
MRVGRGTQEADPTTAAVLWRVVPALLLVAVLAGATAAITPLGPPAVAVVVGIAVAIWQRPVVAAVVVAAVVPALSGLGRGMLVPGLKISELLLLACAVVVFVRRPRVWRRVSGVDLGLGAFAVAGLGFAVLHHLGGVDGDADTLLRSGLLPAFLFVTWWTASRSVENRGDLVVVLRWVLGLSLVPALIGLGQYVEVPGVREAVMATVGEGLMPTPGEADPRITGPFPIAHSFGGYLIVPLVLAAGLLLRGDRSVLRRWQLVLVLLVDAAAMVLAVTITFFAWVPVAVLVVGLALGRLRRAAILLAAAGAVAAVVFATALDTRLEQQATPATGTGDGLLPQTVQYRILIWQRDYLPLLGRAAAVGLGIDSPESVQFTATENQYLTLVLRGGVGLLLAAVLALASVGARALRTVRVTEGAERTAAATVLGILAFLPFAAMVWPYVTNAGFPQAVLGFAGAALAVEHARPSRFSTPLYGVREGREPRALTPSG